jgi:HD-GYP domain-containing protein (c-di-GMP phosphodiesterase class II)
MNSLDLQTTLAILLSHVTRQLGVDAADILLYSRGLQVLEYGHGRGFRSTAVEQTRLRLGEDYAGQAALERRRVAVADLRAEPGLFRRAALLAGEAFISLFCLPLVVKGQLVGVLEIFHRTPLDPDADWVGFLETLASQAAIAVADAWLFADLQRSNADMLVAYDTTLEGWSAALDLRDKETEGHSQRVCERTLRLARVLGISDSELVHIRRGALLHDIGKMGVPDSILLKPGKLTDDEWVVMRQHPQLAFDLLAPIAFLRPALDIPYCHHEKWDGTGYPRQLKGEAIPLAARIFAVVDVWDALCSNRPYRLGWPSEKVLAHIIEQSGQHFDPKVVQAFCELMQSDPGAVSAHNPVTH